MAMYSVFDLDSQRYDYFQAKGPELGQRVSLRARGMAGVEPDAVLPRLPVDALHIGTGQDPRGILAVRGFGSDGSIIEGSSFLLDHPYLALGLIVSGVYLLYKIAD